MDIGLSKSLVEPEQGETCSLVTEAGDVSINSVFEAHDCAQQ